jgi:hypothetical protein
MGIGTRGPGQPSWNANDNATTLMPGATVAMFQFQKFIMGGGIKSASINIYAYA